MSNKNNDSWKHDTLKLKPVQSRGDTSVDPSLVSNEYTKEEKKNISGYTLTLIVIGVLIVCLSVLLAIVNNSDKAKDESQNPDMQITDIIEDEVTDDKANHDNDEEDAKKETDDIKEEDESPVKDEQNKDEADDESNVTSGQDSQNIDTQNPQTPEVLPDPEDNTPSDDSPSDIPDISELD